MQSWNGEKIFCISDVPKGFHFLSLKEMAGGTGLMKKLFKDEISIPAELMPKLLLHTNYSVEITDGGLKRRVKIIEFTDFFTKAGGIDIHFGVHFPNGWNQEDWNGYDTVMVIAIQRWLKGGRKIGASTLSAGGWMKQFEQTHGQVITNLIKEKIGDWVQMSWISNEEFKNNLVLFYNENNTPHNYQPSTFKVNKALKEYCDYKGIQFRWDIERRENGIKHKYRWFGTAENTPF